MNIFSQSIAIAETLLAYMPVGILVYEGDTGKCVLANQAVAEMLGGSVEALRRQPFQTLAARCRLAESALHDRSSGRHEVTLQTASNNNVTLGFFISWFDFEGKSHLMCTITDITERKRTQAKLERERALLRCLIDSASDLIFIKDQDSVYCACNKASEAFIGIPESEQIGKTDYDFFDREKAEEIRKADRQVIDEGKPVHYEEWVRGQDGRLLLMDTVKTPYYDPDGRPLGLVGIGRDQTERRNQEEERLAHLKLLENMDRVNRAIQASNDLEQMMSNVLGEVLAVFDCDRAFLLYPCDPQALIWKIPMERTKPQYPGAYALNIEIPADPQFAETFRVLQASGGPVQFGPGTDFPVPNVLSEQLDVKRSMSMALHPKQGQAWLFGLHRCTHARSWTKEEERLFQEIGRRIEDALTGLLIHRDLHESEERYRLVFENSPVSIWEEDFSVVRKLFDDLKKQGVTDIETWIDRHPEMVRQCSASVKILDVNQAAVALCGAANKETLFAGLVQIFAMETFDTFRRELVCLWHGGTEMIADSVVKTPAGGRRDVTVYFSVCPGHEQTLSKVLVSILDITERKRNDALNSSRLHLVQFAETHALDELLEETLNEAEQLTGSRIGFYHFVKDDQQTLALQNWSTRTKREFCKAEGKGLHYPVSDAGVWVDCVHQRRPVIHNDYASLPHRKGMPDGHADVIRELVVPVMRGEKIVAILGVGNKPGDYTEKDVEIVALLADLAWEIAERKRAQEEIRRLNIELEQRVLDRTAQLEAANKEMHAFTYTVSHDLRAPLRHIDGFLELLQGTIGTVLDDQSRHYMDAICEAANKMGLLIDDLLAFSRMGRHALSFQPVEMGPLVRDVIRELEPDTAGMTIDWRIGVLPTVTGDAAMLRIVLSNLIANALKFTRTRPQARIEIGSLPGQDAETVIFVRDNGVGFDMTYADKLFGVFQRLHHEDEFEGTGIGLANVRRIIARHRGRTWAEGAPDKGAIFYFSLPHTPQGKGDEQL